MQPFVLSLYIGYALYSAALPMINSMLGTNAADRTILAILIYAVCVGVSLYILRRLGVSARSKKTIHSIVLAILSLGYLLALGYSLFAIDRLISLPPSVAIFFTPVYFFWWFIAPIVGLFLLTF